MLPCGAGKSLVGVSAACRIRKSCLCLATNAVSVDQWAFQFKLWSTIKEEQICRFTSDSKERFRGNAGVVVTTYNMIAFGGKRSEEAEKIIEEIRNREWGLLLMDEVMYPSANILCLSPHILGEYEISLDSWWHTCPCLQNIRCTWFLLKCSGRSLL